MSLGMRCLMLLLLIFPETGCQTREPIPVLKPITTINARVNEVPEWGLSPIESVVVPESEVSAFAKLITPTTRCSQRIDPDISYHVADVMVGHSDGTESKLMVFSTGHNPAAISLDNKSYFYGGVDAFPDGATRIIRLLREYDYERSKTDKLSGTEKSKEQKSKVSGTAETKVSGTD